MALNQKAFDKSVKTYHKVRGNSIQCLHAAIRTFISESAQQHTLEYSGLQFATADDADGKNTILVITGFSGPDAIESFLAEALRAPGK